jgi:flavorubredoxin
MEPIQLTDGVYDVGVIDWNIRDFHGYSTDIGTTYNSFLIVDEKTVLIDTVRKEFSDQLIDNIAAVIDPKKIDYVISNHTELDHSGGLARVMHKIGEDKPVYASKSSQAFPAKPQLSCRRQRGSAESWQTNLDVS